MTDLVTGKALPARFIDAAGKVRYSCLKALYRQRVEKERSGQQTKIPPWLYTDPSHGKRIFDSLFRYCVTQEWGLVMDKKEKKVDPRLHRLRQKEWLHSLCGRGNWDTLISRYKLGSGLKMHYRGRVLDAFKANFAWAFDPTVEGHLDELDFAYAGIYKETETGGIIWRMVDHWLKHDLGVTLYDPETNRVDYRLLPKNRGALAKTRGFKHWDNFERTSGLYLIIMRCSVARPVIKRERAAGRTKETIVQIGNLGHVLKWYCPEAFDPRVPGHLHVNDFSHSPLPFGDLAEKKEAILHLAIEDRIPIAEMSAFLTRGRLEAKGIPNLLEDGESALELFVRCFAEELARGELVKEQLYAPVEANAETSTTSINGRTFTLAGNLTGHLARQETPEYVVVYKRTRMVSAGPSFKVTPAYVVYLNEPQKAVPAEKVRLPNQDHRETLSRLLLKGEGAHAPVVIQTLPAEIQANAVEIFESSRSVTQVYRYLESLKKN